MISKKELLDMLWGVANDKPEAIEIRNIAAKDKSRFWKSDEWIYIKDTEVALKMICKELKKSDITFNGSMSSLVLDGSDEELFSQSKWALEKIKECRENMQCISNPD